MEKNSTSTQPIDSSQKEGKNENQEKESSFECNICLEQPVEPVISLCGHLFCWPCIYEVSIIFSVMRSSESSQVDPKRRETLSSMQILDN
jgi:hypothetical protein